jgi:regulator of replication initiation timing
MGWFVDRFARKAFADLQDGQADQLAGIAGLDMQLDDLAAEVAILRDTVAAQANEIERLRIEGVTLERRLDAETSERTKLGQALSARIEGIRR